MHKTYISIIIQTKNDLIIMIRSFLSLFAVPDLVVVLFDCSI